MIISLTLLVSIPVPGQFVPISLTPESFNQDIVVERSAPPPAMAATTASVETGCTNTGYSWFEKGYNANYPATGLPAPGSVISSELTMDHEYQFAPDYRSNNAVLIDSSLTHAELKLNSPASFSALSFLLSGAHDSASAPITVVVHHQDGSAETATIRCQDWLNAMALPAYSGNGRVNVTTFTFANINAGLPRLFSTDITLTNAGSAVTSVELSYVSGSGHSVVMALSGAMHSGDPFGPITVSGYNADVVVEASATRAQALLGVTTATMSAGAANRLWTWYERGYVPGCPDSGLPIAGSSLTHASAPGRAYQLAPNYTGNNVALVDMDSPSINLIPVSPVSCNALSFLTAAAGAQTTNLCVMQHADGSSQTNPVVSPAWNDGTTPFAYNAAGRININNRLLESVNSSEPRLFTAELAISNATSPITNILVRWSGESTAAHTAFLAVSGRAGTTQPPPAKLSVQVLPGGALRIQSSTPGQLEYTTALEGAATVWHSAGAITDALTITLEPSSPVRFYRVLGL